MTGAVTALIIATAGLGVAQQAMQGDMGGGQHGPAFDFEELDADGDGRITRDEMAAQAQARFGAADADGDGKLSPQEMAERMQARMMERMARRVEQMIARQDSDGDGLLSMEEMQAGRMGRMFDRHDADGDGAISAEEFEDMANMRAERMSRARDGKGHGEQRHHKQGDYRHGHDKDGHDKGGHGMKGHHMRTSHEGHAQGGGVSEIHYHTHHHYYSGQGDGAGMERRDHMNAVGPTDPGLCDGSDPRAGHGPGLPCHAKGRIMKAGDRGYATGCDERHVGRGLAGALRQW